MKRALIIIVVALLLIVTNVWAENVPSVIDNIDLFATVYAVASVMIGVTVPFFSYGAGAQLHYDIPGTRVGMLAEIEWNARGGYDTGVSAVDLGDQAEPHGLHYIDINIGPRIGRRLFFAAAASLGILVAKGDAVDWPEQMGAIDFGSLIEFGYVFDTHPKFLISLDAKFSGVNAYNKAYFDPSNNLTWGLTFGFSP